MDAPVGVASAIWPHGRWRFDFTGEGNHAGTTRLAARRDPMLPFARTVLAAREAASRHDAVATMGKVLVTPNGVNAVPSSVAAWLDERFESDLLKAALAGPAVYSTYTGPRSPGSAVQDFPTEMFRCDGTLFGDPDFDILSIQSGSANGLPSPGRLNIPLIEA